MNQFTRMNNTQKEILYLLNNISSSTTVKDYGGKDFQPAGSPYTVGIDDWGDLQDTIPAVRKLVDGLISLAYEEFV